MNNESESQSTMEMIINKGTGAGGAIIKKRI
jgi:hypothetical protein